MNVGTGLNKAKTVTIKNGAKTGVLKGSTAVSGNFFTITAGNGPFNLNAGQSQPVTVTFAPTAAGAAKGTLAITSNDPKKPVVNVKLTGAGQAGKLGVPASVLFPTTTSTKPASNKTFAIKNTGLGVLHGTLGAITGTGDFFRTAPLTSGFTLQHLATLSVTIEFTPQAKGSSIGHLNIISDDPKRLSFNVTLKGTRK
jgi:Abnormal spindle-like microcephaly-assoc'd, ASPM-SPD-2-Hydin